MILRSFFLDQEGASAAEYALILALVGSAIAIAVFVLSGTIANGINRAANCLGNVSNSGC